MAGRATTPPTDVVCDQCSFGGGAAHTVSVQRSIRSGVTNSTLCRAKYPALTLTIGALAMSPVNAGNTLTDCAGSGGGNGGGGGTITTKITLVPSARTITFGKPLVLTGAFKDGRVITVLARPHGATTFKPVTTVRTGASGAWRAVVHPTTSTTYRATSRSAFSPDIHVDLKPRIALKASRGRLLVRVTEKPPLRGIAVVLQAHRGSAWIATTRKTLARDGSASFVLPRRGAVVRVVVPASRGYVRALSPPWRAR
jgi:hypothetical protein